jgi:Ca2+-binding RTX toxin-like protein
LTGTAFNDTLDGGAGADKLIGGFGNDTYIVDGADVVTESSSAGGIDQVMSSVNHVLGSNVENLTLTGANPINGTGNGLANTITGNSGTNVIDGKAGVDNLNGGEGSDVYLVGVVTDHAAAEFADSGTGGVDEVRFTATKSGTLTLFAGDTGIERIVIGTGTAAAAVTTGTGALRVDASAVGNGVAIVGNAGANVITGTAYADTIAGGNGNDVLTGGAGADLFVFSFAPNTWKNKDTLTDFQTGVDVLQFSKAVFIGLGSSVGGLAPAQFWSGAGVTTAHDADDRIIYNTATGILYYDADGTGATLAVQVALLGTTTHPALTAADIEIIA